MNEKVCLFSTGLVIGAIICTLAGYVLVIQPSVQRAGQLRTEIESARDDNQRLIELSEQRTVALEQCRDIIISSRGSIDKLRSILTILQETDPRIHNSVGSIRDTHNR